MRLLEQFLTRNDCYQAGRTIVPKGVMVHSTGANNPNICRYVPGDDIIGRNKLGNHWDRSGVEKCVHAFVGKLADGSVGTVQTLPWTCRGWHAGSGTTRPSANNTHISFEICEDGLEDPAYFAAVCREAAELTACLCREFDLDPLAGETVICHQEGYRLGMASNHADVLHWFPKFGVTMDDFRAEVAWIMEESEKMEEEKIRAVVRDELAKIEAERAAQPAPEWARELLADAVARGITDGTRPMSAATRMEAAIMARNLTEKTE